MRITESRLRQTIQEVMSEVEEQAYAEEQRGAMNRKSLDDRRAELEAAVYGLLGAYLELDGELEPATNAVLADVKNILGS